MEGAFKRLSLSENNENGDENDQKSPLQLGLKSRNPNKPAIKHFMEPTISASSKAISPRKRILTERNEVSGFTSSDIHQKIPPNPDPKSKPKQVGVVDWGKISSQFSPMSSSSNALASDEEDNTFVPYSSPRPYDPLTNYLSPRPKFLRYKPNRRRDIFLRQASEGRGGGECGLSPTKSASFDSKKGSDYEESSISSGGSSDSYSQEGLLRQENGGSEKNSEEEDDEIEEEKETEEEREWNMKWVLKTLFVFVVLVLSTAYISSMNSPTPSQTLQTISRLKGKFLKIEDMFYRAVSLYNLEGENDFSYGGEKPEIDPFEMGEEVHVSEAEGIEYKAESTAWEWVEEVEVENIGTGGDCQNVEVGKVLIDELIKSRNFELHETEISKKAESWEDYQILGAFELLGNQEAIADSMNDSDNVVEIVDDGSVSKGVEEVTLAKDEEVRVDDIGEKVETIDHSLDEGVEEAKIAENEPEWIDDNISKAIEIGSIALQRTEEPIKQMLSCLAPYISKAIEIGSIALQKIEESIMQMLSCLAPYNVVLLAILLTSLVISLMAKLFFKCKKAFAKSNSLNVKLSSGSGIAEKCSISPPTKELKKLVQIAEINNAPPIGHSMEEKVLKETPPRSGAPSVQLLGEFVFGEVSSSVKSSAMRSKMSERIDESSNAAVPQERRSKSRAPSGVSSHDQGSPSEFSAMEAPSYGSYTSQEKIVKEDGKDGETMKVILTPVRRSSRIRNRGVMSP